MSKYSISKNSWFLFKKERKRKKKTLNLQLQPSLICEVEVSGCTVKYGKSV